MVVYQAVGVADPVVVFVHAKKRRKEGLPVLVVPKDSFLFVPARRYVMHRTGIFDAQGADHGARITDRRDKVKHYRPDMIII
jgi:hypothetical protein